MSDINTIRIAELFASIQGESTFAGLPCFFVRLAGCNLECVYCDTPAAKTTGELMSIASVVASCSGSQAPLIEITGGEPLLQQGFVELAAAIRDGCDKTVLVETNGSCDISRIPDGVIAVVDVKTPGSGMVGSFDEANIGRLRHHDEVKFVLCDWSDYEWASDFVRRHDLTARCAAILFSPVWGRLEPSRLAEWLLADGLPARLRDAIA